MRVKQNMRRIELIPQTAAAINSGKVWYHFSISRSDANAPSVNREHQICFFESHFTELKYGWISGESGTSDPYLQFMISQNSKWKTEWKAGVWHNVAFEIVSSFAFRICPVAYEILLTFLFPRQGLLQEYGRLLALGGRRAAHAARGAAVGVDVVQRGRLAPGGPGAASLRLFGRQRGLLLFRRLHRERLPDDFGERSGGLDLCISLCRVVGGGSWLAVRLVMMWHTRMGLFVDV